MEGHFSIKSAVFSFGVLLLEIITGRKNSSYYTEDTVNLIGHVSIKHLYAVDVKSEHVALVIHEMSCK